jgi:hypothetical protein
MPPRAAVVVSALHSNLDGIIKQLYYHAATFLLQRLFSQSSQLSYTVSASDKKPPSYSITRGMDVDGDLCTNSKRATTGYKLVQFRFVAQRYSFFCVLRDTTSEERPQ